ncbi:MFS transporter [Anaerosporomusa subterranea]|uniref:MFS transporter n=1 Tax=Anaerosporomusa subterranea TaxID=1794912 RepID=A0A154BWB5_ANASB|nr:MFS transporter [Anaerosporomusa subterranea]KYZ78080.1 MFS transporter [Anaerosporomusa subterranea]
MENSNNKNSNIKPVIAISLLTAACLVGDSMLYIVLPTHWQEAGLSSLWEVGVLLSANRLIRLPLNPIVGWLYQRISSRIGVLLATLLAVITTASYGLLQGFWLLLAMRCIWGIAWTFLRLGAYFTILDFSSDNNRGHFMGTYNGLFRLGSLVGMLAGGLLADSFGLKTTAILFAALTACSIPCIFLFIPKALTHQRDVATGCIPTAHILKEWPVVWALLTGAVVAMIYQGLFNATISHLIKTLYSEMVSIGGFLIGAASLAGILQALRWSWEPWLAPWFGRRSDGRGGRRFLLTSTLLLATALFTLIPLQLPILFWLFLLLLLQVTATILTTLADAVASDVAVSTSKAVVMTAYSFAIDLGAALGPLAAYLLTQTMGPEYTYWFAGVVLGLISLKWLIASPMSQAD